MAMNEIEKAVIRMIRNGKTFFASLIIQMVRVKDESLDAPMGVTVSDGRIYLYYNPNLMGKWKPKEIEAVLEHEIEHVVFLHILRARKRYPLGWNIATDIAINQHINNLPKGCLFPEMFNLPRNKIAEFYYDKLPKKKGGGQGQGKGQGQGQGQGKGQGQGQGQGKNGGGGAGGGKSNKPDIKPIDDHTVWKRCKGTKLDKEVVKQAVKESYNNSRDKGNIPGRFIEQIEKLLAPPTIPWGKIFKQYVGTKIKAGFKYSWKRPSRRFGERMKGIVPSRTIKIAVAIDTSGSISPKDFREFLSELNGILKTYKNKTKVLICDAELQKVYDYKPYQQLDVKFEGRGGTDFRPVFAWLQKEWKPDLLIYFTDTEGTFPSPFPTYPVLWILPSDYDGLDVPFGTKVKINHAKEEE